MGMTGDIQLQSLLYACGLGFLLGLYYELFRTVRLLLPPTSRSCLFQDVFFCLSAALITFFSFLAIADGNMYPYLFMGEIAGFFSFYCTPGRAFHKVLAKLLEWLLSVLRFVKQVLSRPIYIIYHCVFRFFRRICTSFNQKLEEIRKKPKKISKNP